MRSKDLHTVSNVSGFQTSPRPNLDWFLHLASLMMLIFLSETDAPWCQIRPSHAGAKFIKTSIADVKRQKFSPGKTVKGRNEPQHLIQVLEVVAGCRGESVFPFLLDSISFPGSGPRESSIRDNNANILSHRARINFIQNNY